MSVHDVGHTLPIWCREWSLLNRIWMESWKRPPVFCCFWLQEGEKLVKKIGGVFAFKVKDGPGGKEATWTVDVKNGKGSVSTDSGKVFFFSWIYYSKCLWCFDLRGVFFPTKNDLFSLHVSPPLLSIPLGLSTLFSCWTSSFISLFSHYLLSLSVSKDQLGKMCFFLSSWALSSVKHWLLSGFTLKTCQCNPSANFSRH